MGLCLPQKVLHESVSKFLTVTMALQVVLSPIEGGPAQRAGILSGDELVQIDSKLHQLFELIMQSQNETGLRLLYHIRMAFSVTGCLVVSRQAIVLPVVMCIVYVCVKGDGLWKCLMYCTDNINSICCTADVALAGMNNEEVATKLRGRAGTSVTLKVRRAVSMINVWFFFFHLLLYVPCKLKSRDCLCFLMVPC